MSLPLESSSSSLPCVWESRQLRVCLEYPSVLCHLSPYFDHQLCHVWGLETPCSITHKYYVAIHCNHSE